MHFFTINFMHDLKNKYLCLISKKIMKINYLSIIQDPKSSFYV